MGISTTTFFLSLLFLLLNNFSVRDGLFSILNSLPVALFQCMTTFVSCYGGRLGRLVDLLRGYVDPKNEQVF